VLVIDDWAMAPMQEAERREVWEIFDDRYQTRSTVLTSQLPVARWHEQIGDPSMGRLRYDASNRESAAADANVVSMSVDKHSSRSTFLASRVFYVGFGLYLLSFFLPAVTLAGMPMAGWTCALESLWMWAVPDHSSILIIFGGVINPLAITCAILRSSDKHKTLRLWFSIAILFCIPFTWLCLLTLKMGFLLGHVVWIAGLLLMIVSEAALQHEFNFLRYGGTFALLILGWCIYRWPPRMNPITDRDEFFYSVSTHFKAPQACSKIGHYVAGGFSEQPGYQIAYLQTRCFYDLAQITKDDGLCKHVRPLHYENQDGRRYSPEGCREQVSDPVPQGSAYLQRENFVRLMEAAGFEAAAMAFRRERYRNDAAFFDLYEHVRQDEAFTSALHRMPDRTLYENVNWRQWPRNPPVAEQSRPAAGAEYLLAMLGMDQTDGKLCNKISFAARYQYPDGKTVSLREVCILHVGFYGRQGDVCAPGICQDSLRADRYPDMGEPVYVRPAFFPDLQSFKAALDEVGYSPTIDAHTLPKPTYDDYIEFFYHAAEEGGPGVRSDFVRRVMSIN